MEPKVHTLKSWQMFFEDIMSGERTSDIRCTDDRDFKVGDIMCLQEFDPVKFIYTGRSQLAKITYIQQNKSNPCAISRLALANNYAVLSIKKVSPEEVEPKLSVSDTVTITCAGTINPSLLWQNKGWDNPAQTPQPVNISFLAKPNNESFPRD